MTRRAKQLWLIGASIFTVVNLVGIGMAVTMREVVHSWTHVVLSVVGMYAMWRLLPRVDAQEVHALPEATAGLEQLQQSVDAIAVEVERIGEAQRFDARLKQERKETDR
jgi:hypothetical protein